jgi:PPOX class probable F420-dependent enzyme
MTTDPPPLDRARELGAGEQGLAVVATTRAEGSVQATVVNAGVLPHPRTGEPVVGFVTRGAAKRLTYLRARPQVTVVFRSGWDWLTVEGEAELVGPDDPADDIAPSELASLRRRIYAAAVGGDETEWVHLDDVMDAERHTAVLVRPHRVYSNPTG